MSEDESNVCVVRKYHLPKPIGWITIVDMLQEALASMMDPEFDIINKNNERLKR